MSKTFDAVLEGFRSLREAAQAGDLSLKQPSIPYLLGAINATEAPSERSMLFSLLAGEYNSLDMEENELHALIASAAEEPSDPNPRVDLCTFHLLRERYPDARREAEIAVSLSEQSGEFRRHALQTLARTLRKQEAFDELSEILKKLIELRNSVPDARVEIDFLVNLPPNALPSELVEQYRRSKA